MWDCCLRLSDTGADIPTTSTPSRQIIQQQQIQQSNYITIGTVLQSPCNSNGGTVAFTQCHIPFRTRDSFVAILPGQYLSRRLYSNSGVTCLYCLKPATIILHFDKSDEERCTNCGSFQKPEALHICSIECHESRNSFWIMNWKEGRALGESNCVFCKMRIPLVFDFNLTNIQSK